MKFYKNQTPKIYHQGVDTLRTAHIIVQSENYIKYEGLLRILASVKDEAIQANINYEFENGISFELGTFGKFFMRPKGQGRYKYAIYNQDIEILFSTVKHGSNDYTTPQIVVDYRAKYLSLLGHEKAYSLVQSTFEVLLSTDNYCDYSQMFKTQLMRIDLCTDVGGLDYTPLDKYKFQTNFKNQGHIEFKEHLQFNRLTGFSFGKGDYMMRVYNKRHQLNNDASKLWLTTLWEKNGYYSSKNDKGDAIYPSVWRHEVQLRRPYLKRFRKDVVLDEVLYFFNILPSLWIFAFNKVTYVDISEEETLKIMNFSYTPDALRQLFYRTKRDTPCYVWTLVSLWHGVEAPLPKDFGKYQHTDTTIAKRFFKAFISTAYKCSDGDPYSVLSIMDTVQEDLQYHSGTSLHDYGSNKVLSSYIDNSQFISNNGLVIHKDFKALSIKMYHGMRERFLNLGDPLFNRNEYRLASILNMTVSELRDCDIQSQFDYAFNENIKEIEPIYEIEYI